MAEQSSGYKHDSSDRKLDQSAEAANESGQGHDTQHSSGPAHERERFPNERDADEDRASKSGEQHDDAEKGRGKA